ncbi:MFS general substrate transporter [Amniculicola lignicola CBS 123094]|uniref:MFS general substrate transporter n=1 Tax=Amniculicola lignicola CBS 123094 TaxID=1392246 RepID=A0A6A5W9F3_9PLEO|nr:MFS general substrate transporter [Amniculicola lignicola CBS 123094]
MATTTTTIELTILPTFADPITPAPPPGSILTPEEFTLTPVISLQQNLADPTDASPKTKKSKAFKAAFASVCVCSFASLLDTVIVATALPAISTSLNAPSNQAYWCGTGFLFAQAISQPVYGALSGTFGRKACLLFALGVFIIASVFCATATSIEWLIVARVFQGIGAGGNNAMVSVIVTDMVPLSERGEYIGYLSVSGALASVSGNMIGAAVAGRSNWRIIFWINLPICVPAFLGIYYFLHLELESESVVAKLKKIDWIGIVMLTGPCLGLLYGITSGNIVFSWTSPQILSAVIIGILGIAGFFAYEAKIPKLPMIPVRIFMNRTSNGAYFCSFMMGFVLWAMQYYLILYFLVSRRHSLLGAGVCMLPGTLTLAASGLVAALIIMKTQKFKYLHTIGWALMTLGFGLITTLSPTSNGAMQFGYQAIYGLGGGAVFLARICAVQASQEDEDVGMATALISFITSIGQAFGVGVGGVIFQNLWSARINSAVSSNLIPKQYVLGPQEVEMAGSLIQAFPVEIQHVYTAIMAQVIDRFFVVLTIFSGVAFLVSLGVKDLGMTKETKSAQKFSENALGQRVDGETDPSLAV